ncbi:hypothetical protein BDZ89DRAFT_1020304 [Hymenopellis radicata]|nr:hypothetical protein BDZ89DRAFT_1020304 [Hymenopellis radicata]
MSLKTMIPVESLPPGLQIATLSGPMIIGFLMNACLFGTLTVQLYLYYEAFPEDRLFNKCLAYGIYIMEFVQTVLIMHDAFAMFGSGFGDVQAITDIHFEWFSIPTLSGLVAFVGQTFYAYRIYTFTKRRAFPVVILAISLTSSIAGFVAGAFTFEAGNLTRVNNRRLTTAVGVWCGGAALSDTLIATCMTYYLLQSDTGFRHTHALISKLIRLTIETGSVTALVNITALVLFFALPGTMFQAGTALLIPKLYANMIFVVLNSRLRIVGGRATYTSSADMVSFPSIVWRDEVASDGRRHPTIGRPVVSITREAFSDRNTDDRVEMKTVGESRSNVDCV